MTKPQVQHEWYMANRERIIKRNTERKHCSRSNPETWVKQALQSAKSRANKRNIIFDIVETDIEPTLICPVFGIKIEYGAGKNNPNGPSLDRTIPELGYVTGNVRVISYRANTLKQDATKNEVVMILQYMENLS